MRHRVKTKTLGRTTKHRKALLAGLVRSLVEHGRIVTTRAKAKEAKRLADKYIRVAQKDDALNARRQLHRVFGKRDVVNALVDRVAPAMKDRTSGFTTLKPAGVRRGDNTQLVELALVNLPEGVGSLKNPQPAAKKPSTKKATSTAKSKKSTKSAKSTAKKTAKKAKKSAKTSK